MGLLINVPKLPPDYLPRPEALNILKRTLLENGQQKVGVTGTNRELGVQGMGGIGKSVLAAALAHDDDVRRAFPDGIYWITLGQNPPLTVRQADLIGMVSGERSGITDVQQGRIRLEAVLAGKACLVIVDDVWQLRPDLIAFDVVGQRGQLLFTTRHADVVQQLGAVEHRVELLDPEAALNLGSLVSCGVINYNRNNRL